MRATDSPVGQSGAIAELVAGARALGLVLGSGPASQFESYLDNLLLWRRRLSLISVADVHLIVELGVVADRRAFDGRAVGGFARGPGYLLARAERDLG